MSNSSTEDKKKAHQASLLWPAPMDQLSALNAQMPTSSPSPRAFLVSSFCCFGSVCAFFFTECSAAAIGSGTECTVSIAGDGDCFGCFFGVADLLCAFLQPLLRQGGTRDMLRAIETANNHEREGARVCEECRKLNCLHVFGIGNSRPRVLANIRNFWSFSARYSTTTIFCV